MLPHQLTRTGGLIRLSGPGAVTLATTLAGAYPATHGIEIRQEDYSLLGSSRCANATPFHLSYELKTAPKCALQPIFGTTSSQVSKSFVQNAVICGNPQNTA